MNKPVKLVLALSISINAIWLIGAATGWLSFGKASGKMSDKVAQAGGSGIGALSPKAKKEVAALLATNDAAALRDQLRALGLPDDVVREVVQARITRRYGARRLDITNTAREEAAQRPYWRPPSSLWNNLTVVQRTEMLMLYREEWKQIRQVLGRDGEIPSQASIIHAYLPPDRAEQFAEMENDYYLMRAEILQSSSRFRTPGDNEKLRLLDDEHKCDIDAMLTLDEKRENSLRNSVTARRLRSALSGFNATEDEYKNIFAMQNALDEKYAVNSVMTSTDYSGVSKSERDAAQHEVDGQIREALGAERYASFLRAQRDDYQILQAAARRFNIDADTVAQTYQVRDAAANEAARISADTGLGTAQKNEAYAALAEQTTGQIRAALGDEVGDAYINSALVWLKDLPKGGNVEIDPKGTVKVTQPKGGAKAP